MYRQRLPAFSGEARMAYSRILLSTGRMGPVQGFPGEVIGHARPHAPRIEVRERLPQQCFPALGSGSFRAAGGLSRIGVSMDAGIHEAPHQHRHRCAQSGRLESGKSIGLFVDGYD